MDYHKFLFKPGSLKLSEASSVITTSLPFQYIIMHIGNWSDTSVLKIAVWKLTSTKWFLRMSSIFAAFFWLFL